MAQVTYITRKDEDADVANFTASGTAAITGTTTLTGATALVGAATFTVAPVFTAVSDITSVGPITKFVETVAFGDFTDGGSTVGTYDITTSTVPVGATFLSAAITAVTGFAGDTSAVLTLGDGSDVDRYNTSTVDVFSTVAAGIEVGVPSGIRYHATAGTIKITITTAADFTSVSAGSLTLEFYYLT